MSNEINDNIEWWYASGGTTFGPVTYLEISRLIKEGALTPKSLVWNEEISDWGAIENTELFSLLPKTKPKPPPLPNGLPKSEIEQKWQNTPHLPISADRPSDNKLFEARRQIQERYVSTNLYTWTRGFMRAAMFVSVAAAVIHLKGLIRSDDQMVPFINTIIDSPLYLTIETSIYLIAIVLYFIWTFKCVKIAKNYSPTEMKVSPSWAVWSHFIPILWFFKPYQAWVQMINIADQKIASNDEQYEQDGGNLVNIWWGLTWAPYGFFIVSALFVEHSREDFSFDLLGYVADALAAVVLITLIERSHRAFGRP